MTNSAVSNGTYFGQLAHRHREGSDRVGQCTELDFKGQRSDPITAQGNALGNRQSYSSSPEWAALNLRSWLGPALQAFGNHLKTVSQGDALG